MAGLYSVPVSCEMWLLRAPALAEELPLKADVLSKCSSVKKWKELLVPQSLCDFTGTAA